MLTKDLSTLARVRWTQPGFRSSAPGHMGVGIAPQPHGAGRGHPLPRPGHRASSPRWCGSTTARTGPSAARSWSCAASGCSWTPGTSSTGRCRRRSWDAASPTGRSSAAATTTARSLRRRRRRTASRSSRRTRTSAWPVPTPSRASSCVAPTTTTTDMHTGSTDVGLLFAAYMRDPSTSFIPTQRRLSASDAFQRWISTIGSAAYVLPGGVAEGDCARRRGCSREPRPGPRPGHPGRVGPRRPRLAAGPAAAHSSEIESSPRAGSVLDESPAEVTDPTSTAPSWTWAPQSW